MKKATCKDLRGVCDAELVGETAEELGNNGKKHVMAMIMQGDTAHKAAADDMMKLSKEDQQKWYNDFVNNFDSLPGA